MRNTNQRHQILKALKFGDLDPPPYSVSHITTSIYPDLWSLEPNQQKTHLSSVSRTLKRLWHEGIVTTTRTLEEPCGAAVLPRWILRFELSADQEMNRTFTQIEKLHKKVCTAKNGSYFFEALISKGATPKQVTEFKRVHQALLQTLKVNASNWPDTDWTLDMLKEIKEWLADGVPEPM